MVLLLSVLLGQPLMLPLEPLLELQFAVAHVGGKTVAILLKLIERYNRHKSVVERHID